MCVQAGNIRCDSIRCAVIINDVICHGKAGFDAFTHEKSVLKKGRLDIPVRYPPYGKKHLGILKKLM